MIFMGYLLMRIAICDDEKVFRDILKKELDDLGRKKEGFISKIANIIRPKQKKLISDYFHS